MLEVATGWDEPFFFRITRGMNSDHRAVTRYAYNPAVTGTETIWSKGGVYSFPSAGSVMQVLSSNAADASNGTGARTVLIQGLDDKFNEIAEIVSLLGVTPVNTVNSYFRINSMYVVTAGSAGQNVGDISIGTGTILGGYPANTYGFIATGDNVSQTSVYTVPVGYQAVVVDSFATAQGTGTGKHTVIYNKGRPPGGVFMKGCSAVVDGQTLTMPNTVQLLFPAGTDWMNMIETNDTNAHVTCMTHVVLIKEGYTVT